MRSQASGLSWKTLPLCFLVATAILQSLPSISEEPPSAQKAAGQGAARNPSNRKATLEFEGEVLEGLNKNPLDSIQSIGKRDPKNNSHLYRKRTQFRKELKLQATELGNMP